MLVTGRYLLSTPWAGTDSGLYWWEHCYFADTSDFASTTALASAVTGVMGDIYTSQVRRRGQQIYNTSTGALLLQQYFGSGNPGSATARPDPTILVVARWRLLADDGSRSYHLHRRLVGSDDVENGRWTSAGMMRQYGSAGTFVGAGIFRSHSGHLLDRWEVAQTPAMWQLRHGTKRRNKRFWAP